MRASDADRDVAADRLRVAAGEGRLDPDELDERLSGVYGARWCSELVELTSDITPPASPVAARPLFVQRPPAKLNLFAVASLVSSTFFFGPGSVAAIPLGYVALKQIRNSEGTQLGRSMALVGVALGFVGVLILLALIGLGVRGADWD